MRRLDDTVSVAGQIEAADLDQLKAEGFTLVINNRPDGEEPGQPAAAEIDAAARAAGLDYRFIPVGGGFSAAQVAAMAEALAEPTAARSLSASPALALPFSGRSPAPARAFRRTSLWLPRRRPVTI